MMSRYQVSGAVAESATSHQLTTNRTIKILRYRNKKIFAVKGILNNCHFG